MAEGANTLAKNPAVLLEVEIESRFSSPQQISRFSERNLGPLPPPPNDVTDYCYTTGRRLALPGRRNRGAMASTSVQKEARLQGSSLARPARREDTNVAPRAGTSGRPAKLALLH